MTYSDRSMPPSIRLAPHRTARKRSRRAFSLVEVLAGLVLMATVMASAMMAFNRHQKQLLASEKIEIAAGSADAILQRLSAMRGGVPEVSSGVVPRQPSWRWYTRRIGLAKPLGVPANVIRFGIVDSDGSEIVRVDVFKPIEGAE